MVWFSKRDVLTYPYVQSFFFVVVVVFFLMVFIRTINL